MASDTAVAAPRLASERLRLEPFGAADLDALHALWTDPGVRRFLWDDQIIARDTARAVIEASDAGFARDGLGMWSLYRRDEVEVCGFCGFRPLAEGAEIELVYGLYPHLWGQGLAVEASRAALAYAFERRGLQRIVAVTDPPNTNSQRVMEKLGMRFWKRGVLEGLDTVFYAITSAEFRATMGASQP